MSEKRPLKNRSSILISRNITFLLLKVHCTSVSDGKSGSRLDDPSRKFKDSREDEAFGGDTGRAGRKSWTIWSAA